MGVLKILHPETSNLFRKNFQSLDELLNVGSYRRTSFQSMLSLDRAALSMSLRERFHPLRKNTVVDRINFHPKR